MSWIWRVAVLTVVTMGGALGSGRAEAQLPAGPGRAETVKLCSQCHEPERATSLRQDRVGWAATLAKMAALGARGTNEEFRAVLEYLATHFPADELPRINVNTARAIELESGLTLRRSHAAAIIAYRTKHGPFRCFEDLKKVPGIDIKRLELKRDRLTF